MRHFIVGSLFVLLLAFSVGEGAFRLQASRDRLVAQSLERLRRDHFTTVRTVRDMLRSAAEQAVFLSRTSVVRSALAGSDSTAWASSADLRAYLLAFPNCDRVIVLDAAGLERLRVERVGTGAAVIPEGRLSRVADPAMLTLSRAAAAGLAACSNLTIDPDRVEVAATNRLVLHHAVALGDAGALVLTTYVEPILASIRAVEPIRGARSRLVDEAGVEVAAGVTGGAGSHPADGAADPALETGGIIGERRDDGGFVLIDAVSERPEWRLVTSAPATAIDAATDWTTGERWRIVGTTVIVAIVLLALALLFVRSARREAVLREREALERRLQINERLTALGRLTAGVAHEINNPLEGIGNWLALLERDLAGEDERAVKRAKWVAGVRHGFNRIRDIVRDLLTSARSGAEGGSASFGAVDLVAVIDAAARLVGYAEGGHGVGIDRSGVPEPSLVHGDAGRLEQVFVNLFLNAAHAMAGRGTITVTARRDAAADGMLEIGVRDEGPGIPDADLQRIFDPFFTTSAEGSGLGLSICSGIVRAHGGQIVAGNAVVGGALFSIRLVSAARKGAS